MIDNFEIDKLKKKLLSCGIGELNARYARAEGAFLRVPFKHPFLRRPILTPKWAG